jgi:hypothetical protein
MAVGSARGVGVVIGSMGRGVGEAVGVTAGRGVGVGLAVGLGVAVGNGVSRLVSDVGTASQSQPSDRHICLFASL